MRFRKTKAKILALSLLGASVASPIIAPIVNSPLAIAATVKNGFYKEGNVSQYYQNGKKSTATGFVKGKTDYWYIINGKVDYTKTGFFNGTGPNGKGTYYVHKNKIKGQAVTVDTNKWYEISPTDNKNFRIDVSGASPASGSNIQLYKANGSIAQKFKFIGAGNGYYYITTATTGGSSALDSGQYKGKLGYQNALTQGNKYQKWKIVRYSNGAYGFYNEQKKEWLDLAGNKQYSNGVNIQTYSYIDSRSNRGAEGQEFILTATNITGFVKENGKWVYYQNGKKSNKTDIVQGNINRINGWYYIKNGIYTQITSVEKNANGWWYVKNGKVDFSFKGIASNSNGQWYLEGGKVNFNKTAVINYQNKKYVVRDSKVVKNTWIKSNGKWSYANKNGIALTGLQKMGKGTANVDGNSEQHLSYFDNNGYLAENKEITVNGKRYWTSIKGWAMEYAKIGDAWYNIRPKSDGNQVLEVYNNSKYNSEKIQLYKNTNEVAQKFYLKNIGDGKVIIYTGTENKKKALDVTGGYKNTTINQYSANTSNQNQIWRVVQNYNSDAFTFINIKTKQAMSIKSVGWGQRLWTSDVNNSAIQKWTLNGTWTPQYQTTQSVINDGKANAMQLKVAQNALNNNSTKPLAYMWCAAWVSGVYQASGLGYPGGNAIDYWHKWYYSGSSSMSNIPIGAAVISNPTAGNGWYGHIGIYVGGGRVVSNLGYKCVESVQSFASRGGFAGWVWPYGKHI